MIATAEKVKESMKLLTGITSAYILWIVLHYMAAHLYANYCTPLTIVGFMISPFNAPSPHCQACRWLIYNGGNTISAMWILFGTWFVQKYLIKH